jgi:LemA protein
MNGITLLVIVVVGVGLYLVSLYNFFQTSLTRIKASIQEIGNQLKRQADLIPNLEASVKGYLSHEKSILTMLADARKAVASAAGSSDINKQSKAASMMGDLLPRLSVIVESNPQLQGSSTVTNLMEELRDTADKVMYARRTLIDLTEDYNVRVVTFPSNLVAGMFSFKEQPGLQVEDIGDATTVSAAETKSPKIKL